MRSIKVLLMLMVDMNFSHLSEGSSKSTLTYTTEYYTWNMTSMNEGGT